MIAFDMDTNNIIHNALQRFADSVKAKMTQLTHGEPEEQLRMPFELLAKAIGESRKGKIICTGETTLRGRIGRPDFALHLNQLLVGYVELKAPGIGANPTRFTGHNREQWMRFRALPNLIYGDGNEWGLYRDGNAIGKIVRFSGDISTDGKKAITFDNAVALNDLMTDFLSWEPIIPFDAKGRIDLKGFAALLAPLCRLLRDNVIEALQYPQSPLVHLANDWRQLLFPDASDEQFADAYAQTVTFALLLGRSDGANPLTLANAESTLSTQHNLLSRALQVLTDPDAQAEISASLDLLLRVISCVPPATFSGPEDPWLYFYEDFLATYDPKLRKDAGAYYTPVEVVRAQVRLIDDLLRNRLGKSLGFADPEVVTLDPAVGTGTYLLGVIDHALSRIRADQGTGAVPGQATTLARNLYGFEIMVGPYAVTELRVSRALRGWGAELPKDGTHIYLTDTLESPHAEPPQLPLILKPIADQHRRALEVKDKVPVIVCLGNPPYDRHEAASNINKARTGGWVRWGDEGQDNPPIFGDFLNPAIAAGYGIHVKWLYNLYVYFWRWALWKVFEHETSRGPGIVSFITASSYLFGDAFVGLREHMRRVCDEIWILDLGGEGRGARKDKNVFAIQTPVAIAVAVRYGKAKKIKPAAVHYTRIEGTGESKLTALDSIADFSSAKWQNCPDGWQASFLPLGEGDYFNWPIIQDLFPWQHSGLMLKRTWPIAPERHLLEIRWRELLSAPDRSIAFRGSGDREVDGTYRVGLTPDADTRPIASLPSDTPSPPIIRYAYRSFDRQYLIADGRLIARPRTELWRTQGEMQLYLIGRLWKTVGKGPALSFSSYIPDFDSFKGSDGDKGIIPLYRTADGTEANILPGLLDLLGKTYKRKVTPEDFLAYVSGVLAQPAFTARYAMELEKRELRVPITRDATLFAKVRVIGARLLWLHTYGECFVPKGKQRGQLPRGAARCVKAIPGSADSYPETFQYNDATRTLRIGDGEFAPVSPEVFAFEVSGLKVVQSWLKYRMKKAAGKKSSPLDDIRPERWTGEFTTELLELIWVLEATVAGYPEQAKLLEAVLDGPCFHADELPVVPVLARKPPTGASPKAQDLFDNPDAE